MRYSGNGIPAPTLGRVGDTYEQAGGATWEKFPGSFGGAAYWEVIATPADLVPHGPPGTPGRDGQNGSSGLPGLPGLPLAPVNKSAAFTADAGTSTAYSCDISGGSYQATLPSALASQGVVHSFSITGGGTGNILTVAGGGIQPALLVEGDGIIVAATGGAWYLVGDARQAPTVRVSKSGAQAITTATVTTLTFDTETYDNAAMHSLVSNTSRLVCPVAGVYDLSFFINFAANATGVRQVLIHRNGAVSQEYDDIKSAPSSGECHIPGVFTFHAAAGDYVEIKVYQDSGGNLNISATNTYAALSLRRPDF